MIVSVSKRTDIPNYYADWFYERLKAGYVEVRNPMYQEQKSKIDLSVENVDCFVFWTKNPKNMIPRLQELDGYHYYFQFTLNGYEKEIEPGLPDKEEILTTFKELSEKLGAERVVWRYDPIIITEKYSVEYHIQTFSYLAQQLNGYTNMVVISFLDLYGHSKRNMVAFNVHGISEEDMRTIATAFVKIASENNLKIVSCAEKIDLSSEEIEHGSCIDQTIIEKIIGHKLKGSKGKSQRAECGCFPNRDIGVYNTCRNGCKYCYANYSTKDVEENVKRYNVDSSELC